MKKITLLLVSILLPIMSFAQTSLTWTNPVAQVEQGQTITVSVAYEGAGVGSSIQLETSQFPGGTGIFGQTFTAVPEGDGTIDIVYTIDANTPLTEDVAPSNVFLNVLMNPTYAANGNTVIEVLEPGTLSNDSFSKENIAASISQSEGLITIGSDVETESYELYDLSGVKVIDQKANGSIDVSGLSSGVYILATDAGLTKVAF